MNDLHHLDPEQLYALRSQIDGRLAELAGEGLTITTEQGIELRNRPEGGASLFETWAAAGATAETWFRTKEAAQAALLALATQYGRAVDPGALYVDLTAPKCERSFAHVRVWTNEPPTPRAQARALLRAIEHASRDEHEAARPLVAFMAERERFNLAALTPSDADWSVLDVLKHLAAGAHFA